MSQLVLLTRAGAKATPTMDARWDESKHPRKHGQFAPKGTGTTGKSGGKTFAERFSEWEKSANKVHKAMGKYYNIGSAKGGSGSSKKSVEGWKKWLTSKEDSSSKSGGAKGSKTAQALAKWLTSNKKDVSDGQFKKMLELIDRWGKSPAGAYKSVMG